MWKLPYKLTKELLWGIINGTEAIIGMIELLEQADEWDWWTLFEEFPEDV